MSPITVVATTVRPLPIVLASRSPRRQELLALLVGADRLLIRPPADPREAGFDGLSDLPAIQRRLQEIAAAKNLAVREELLRSSEHTEWAAVISADTVVVATDSQQPGSQRLVVLGQPPGDETAAAVIRRWFTEHLLGQEHRVLTAVQVVTPAGRTSLQVVETTVGFHSDESLLDWYTATGEPQGKAGGYAIQGLGSLFVSHVVGSLSNVVGLPLAETRKALIEVGVLTRAASG